MLSLRLSIAIAVAIDTSHAKHTLVGWVLCLWELKFASLNFSVEVLLIFSIEGQLTSKENE
jgi:hypothetical protein